MELPTDVRTVRKLAGQADTEKLHVLCPCMNEYSAQRWPLAVASRVVDVLMFETSTDKRTVVVPPLLIKHKRTHK